MFREAKWRKQEAVTIWSVVEASQLSCSDFRLYFYPKNWVRTDAEGGSIMHLSASHKQR